MTRKTCQLGDDCDLTVAWMAGRESAKDELEAKLERAVRLIEHAVELGRWDLNPSFRDEMIGFTVELKGHNDE